MAVLKALENCISKEKFIEKMKQFGWKVNWTEKRKHITFQNQDGKKVRDSNLTRFQFVFPENPFFHKIIENPIIEPHTNGWMSRPVIRIICYFYMISGYLLLITKRKGF